MTQWMWFFCCPKFEPARLIRPFSFLFQERVLGVKVTSMVVNLCDFCVVVSSWLFKNCYLGMFFFSIWPDFFQMCWNHQRRSVLCWTYRISHPISGKPYGILWLWGWDLPGTLKLTFSHLKMGSWKMIHSLLGRLGLFSERLLLVSGSV